ncbi:MAG: hypothetical protein H6830_08710 [Planctomycetes bacterium]|nr:hypothetical protein [Planctomycetota bacterium]MCB9909645.1 hypothetical protein [Planctomycetota bacterium]MCB9911866.1 hypothetical protein [Planctomycetota bacterium]HPF12685.1 hypothetical protein [Planctomycetota bacterium]
MKRHHCAALAAFACLSTTAWAQVQRTPLEDRIQATFRATDLDKNGTISPQEAAKAGIPARSFALHDKNKDRHLASDEFQAYYQSLILQSRAERARREAEAEAKRKAEAEAKAKAAKDQPVAKGEIKDPVKDKAGATPKPGADTPTPIAQGQGADAQPKPAEEVGQPEPANPDQAAPVEPVASTGGTLPPPASPAGPKVEPATGTPETQPKSDAELVQAEQRARTYIQRLLSKGQISAQDAGEIHQALNAGVSVPSGPQGLTEWRTALNHTKERVTGLVRSGALTALEGREIYDIFEERARRAVKLSLAANDKPVEGSDPQAAKAESGRKIADQAGEGVKPAPEVLPADKGTGLKRIPAKPQGPAQPGKEVADNPAKPAPGPTAEEEAARAKLAHDSERIQNARELIRTQEARERLAQQERDQQAEAARKQAILDREAAKRGETVDKAKERAKGDSVVPVGKPSSDQPGSGLGPAPGARPAPAAKDKPVPDKPALEKPTADKPVTEKPAAEKPAAGKPAPAKPADGPSAKPGKPVGDQSKPAPQAKRPSVKG